MEPREDRHEFLAKTQTHRVFVLFAQCYINRTERRHIDKCLHVNSRDQVYWRYVSEEAAACPAWLCVLAAEDESRVPARVLRSVEFSLFGYTLLNQAGTGGGGGGGGGG